MSARRPFVITVAVAAAALLALSGCSSGKKVDDKGKSAIVNVKEDKALHGKLPASVQKSGHLSMATDPSYAPIEFTKSGGGYQGFDIDLANAIGKVLGVTIDIKKAQFDGILAGLNAGRFDFSMSAFTDNSDREKGNDFVTYFKAGTSIGVLRGNPKHIQSQDDLCGLKVGAEKGTTQAAAMTKKTIDGADTLLGTCLKEHKKGPIPVLLPDQGQVNSAVVSGRADAFTGDTPVVIYQGTLEGGKIEVGGKTTDVAPYGIAFKKGSPLVSVFQKAVNELIQDGAYKSIIDTWNLASGALTEAKINDAG